MAKFTFHVIPFQCLLAQEQQKREYSDPAGQEYPLDKKMHKKATTAAPLCVVVSVVKRSSYCDFVSASAMLRLGFGFQLGFHLS